MLRISTPDFVEHGVPRDHGSVYARDYARPGPALLPRNGFPTTLEFTTGRCLTLSPLAGMP
jgi:hypothetical protein